MQAVILKCKPRARFHFGGLALDNNAWLSTTSEWLPSDTLFSAIINNLATICDKKETERLMGHFLEGKVLVSSGFYLLESLDKIVYFLPKPAHFNLHTPNSEYKKYSAIQLISKTVWEAGWLPAEWPKHCVLLQKGKVLAAKSDLPAKLSTKEKNWTFEDDIASKINLYQVYDYPRVKVHTRKTTENFYHFAALNIADNSLILPATQVHLYFLVDNEELGDGPDWQNILAAIRMLPHNGLGGERAAGCGFCEDALMEPFQLNVPDSGWFASVSLTLPATEPELKKAQYYQIQTRGGRQYGSAEKKFDYVRMLAEGAVSNGKMVGQCFKFNQKNEGHDVFRYGKAFNLRTIHIPESDLSI